MRSWFLAATLLAGGPAVAGPIDHSAAVAAMAGPSAVLIDVRTSQEFAAGALPGAQHIPHFRIAEGIAAVAPDKDTPIVLYCRSGRRSSLAQDRLLEMGYRHVINAGGYQDFGVRLAER
ncbi:hypothetical protein SF06_10070 [Pseudomonas flexibilis]|uniref:Phage shock protein E n=1 Tax=Pseudomonas flexibilis TaxID=706570 RepID=A0A1N6UX04_9PSED|nr:rhodanese-like domain-containing protein [Pseudomonas flexibilis]KHL70227.1 hypothetical protein SF06_10070 [Pseudomonas flexibilis]SIQ70071.1 phage shock protein E [Pseudomonas flexibilis]